LDQAFRRRFSFVDMPADASILASWLEQHPPMDAGDDAFAIQIVRVFEELNGRLAREIGPEKQVGHSFFMVPDLNPPKLETIWAHNVRPLLLDYLGGREERLKTYTIPELLNLRTKARKKRKSDAVNG
jgi:5-methylcytosine-specific restriction enzyme B